LIEVKRLTFAYRTGGRQVEVLKGVDFNVDAGDYVAIQGPSGSGKSTLFYILGCLLRPTGGSVRLAGLDLGALGDDAAAAVRSRRVGFVFQQFHLLPRASVLDNILLPAAYPQELPAPPPELKDQALALAVRLGLGDHLAHLPNQLSGGQQQRGAIARALLRDVSLLLADEPTGNLDSKSAGDILGLFDELNAQGRTIIVITHDQEVAARCRRTVHVRDGLVVSMDKGGVVSADAPEPTSAGAAPEVAAQDGKSSLPAGWSPSRLRLALRSFPAAGANLARNRAKSVLTMLGIVIGIAAVLAMITLGQFTKRRILEGFEALGVNKLQVRAQRNWERKAKDVSTVAFTGLTWEKDLEPLPRIFPQIGLISPVLVNFQNTVTAGGREVSEGVRLRGVNHEYPAISNAHLAAGRGFTPYHIDERASVCILGYGVAGQLFPQSPAVGQMITVTVAEQRSFPCQVIGVLESQKSNQEWFQPDLQILVPYTAFQAVADFWSGTLRDFAVQVRSESDVESTAARLKAYFDDRYGKAAKVTVDTEGTLVAQTKRFLSIFAALLAAIAFLSLLVGGIGIHNMMLVSVTERIKELGLRKALGATGRSIKVQVLMESVLLCLIAGALGLALGFTATEVLIYAATKLVPKLRFEWVVDPWALAISVGSIAAVGLLSGMVPAIRAERLEVIEALRSE
jgi:macrolide transport system ATP-binding/permease protein